MSAATLQGVVVSDTMDKTVVVVVERVKQHPLYLRRFKVHKRYKAHDEKNEYKVGDIVIIRSCPPKSKDKTWEVQEKVGESNRDQKEIV